MFLVCASVAGAASAVVLVEEALTLLLVELAAATAVETAEGVADIAEAL